MFSMDEKNGDVKIIVIIHLVICLNGFGIRVAYE
jgi:hypothetical protein